MSELLGGVPYKIRRSTKRSGESDEDRKSEPEMEWNGHLAQAAFHGHGVQSPAVIALLARELIALAIDKAEKQVELAKLVGELRLEVGHCITAGAVVLL